jgi:hypothetical protein
VGTCLSRRQITPVIEAALRRSARRPHGTTFATGDMR